MPQTGYRLLRQLQQSSNTAPDHGCVSNGIGTKSNIDLLLRSTHTRAQKEPSPHTIFTFFTNLGWKTTIYAEII